MKRLSLIVSLVCSLAGCSASNGPTELPKYHGLSRAAVVGQLGQPDRDETFRMSDAGPSEFRIELQNTYPLSKPENAAVLIEEMTWKDGDHRADRKSVV